MNKKIINKSLPEMWFSCMYGLGASQYMKATYEQFLLKHNLPIPNIRIMGSDCLEKNVGNSREQFSNAKIIVDWLGDSNYGINKKKYAPDGNYFSYNSDKYIFEGANIESIMLDIYNFYNDAINKDTKLL